MAWTPKLESVFHSVMHCRWIFKEVLLKIDFQSFTLPSKFRAISFWFSRKWQSFDNKLTFLKRVERKNSGDVHLKLWEFSGWNVIVLKKMSFSCLRQCFIRSHWSVFPWRMIEALKKNLYGNIWIKVCIIEWIHIPATLLLNNTVPRLPSAELQLNPDLVLIRYYLIKCCSVHCLCSRKFWKVFLCKCCVSAVHPAKTKKKRQSSTPKPNVSCQTLISSVSRW